MSIKTKNLKNLAQAEIVKIQIIELNNIKLKTQIYSIKLWFAYSFFYLLCMFAKNMSMIFMIWTENRWISMNDNRKWIELIDWLIYYGI